MTATKPARPFSADPKRAREARIVDAAEIVRDAIADEGACLAILAAHLGVSSTELQRVTSPTSGRHIALADVLGLPPAVLRRVLADIAETIGCGVVAVPTMAKLPDDLRAIASAQRESGEAIALAIDALADGHLTRAEGAELERECDEAIAPLLALRERARMARREGVIGMARGGAS